MYTLNWQSVALPVPEIIPMPIAVLGWEAIGGRRWYRSKEHR